MHWFNITAICSRDRLDILEDQFWNQGALSVTVEDASDSPIFEPFPYEKPTWQQMVVTGLFEADVKLKEISSVLEGEGFEVEHIHGVRDKAWEREWLKRFQPMRFGNELWVCPSGFKNPD